MRVVPYNKEDAFLMLFVGRMPPLGVLVDPCAGSVRRVFQPLNGR